MAASYGYQIMTASKNRHETSNAWPQFRRFSLTNEVNTASEDQNQAAKKYASIRNLKRW